MVALSNADKGTIVSAAVLSALPLELLPLLLDMLLVVWFASALAFCEFVLPLLLLVVLMPTVAPVASALDCVGTIADEYCVVAEPLALPAAVLAKI